MAHDYVNLVTLRLFICAGDFRYPRNHGLGGCQDYSLRVNPLCFDHTTGTELVRTRPSHHIIHPLDYRCLLATPILQLSLIECVWYGSPAKLAQPGARNRGATSIQPRAKTGRPRPLTYFQARFTRMILARIPVQNYRTRGRSG